MIFYLYFFLNLEENNMSSEEIQTNPYININSEQNRDQSLRVHNLETTLKHFSDQRGLTLGFKALPNTLQGTVCVISGLSGVSLTDIQKLVPKYCEISLSRDTNTFHILIHRSTGRHLSWSQKITLVFIFLLLCTLFYIWKFGIYSLQQHAEKIIPFYIKP